MITYTGLVTLMSLYMPWGELVAFKTPGRAPATFGGAQCLHPARQTQRTESAAGIGGGYGAAGSGTLGPR
jgi:hypothetical protein